MKNYSFEITCPLCGTELEHTAKGRSDRLQAKAVTRCPKCRRSFMVTVTIQPSEYVGRSKEKGAA